jgi:acetylglutamate kinase
VVSTVAPDVDDPTTVLNVNADTAAAALAVALGARKLIVLTDVEGLYTSWPDRTSLVSEISASALDALLPSLESGMVPKMEACLRAVRGGVREAHVIDGRVAHSVLMEVFTTKGIGTMVVPDSDGRLNPPTISTPTGTPTSSSTSPATTGAPTTSTPTTDGDPQ